MRLLRVDALLKSIKLQELASARAPILHTESEMPSTGLAHNVEMHPSSQSNILGYEKSLFTDESDRARVREMIEAQNGSVANFDATMTELFQGNYNMKST